MNITRETHPSGANVWILARGRWRQGIVSRWLRVNVEILYRTGSGPAKTRVKPDRPSVQPQEFKAADCERVKQADGQWVSPMEQRGEPYVVWMDRVVSPIPFWKN